MKLFLFYSSLGSSFSPENMPSTSDSRRALGHFWSFSSGSPEISPSTFSSRRPLIRVSSFWSASADIVISPSISWIICWSILAFISRRLLVASLAPIESIETALAIPKYILIVPEQNYKRLTNSTGRVKYSKSWKKLHFFVKILFLVLLPQTN